MVTKKQKNTFGDDVLTCIKCLEQAHKSESFKGKTEDGNTIIIKFKNKVQYNFEFNEKEYSDFKKLEAKLWGKEC